MIEQSKVILVINVVSFKASFMSFQWSTMQAQFDFENVHKEKLKMAEIFFHGANKSKWYGFLLVDNIMIIKRNNSSSQQLKESLNWVCGSQGWCYSIIIHNIQGKKISYSKTFLTEAKKAWLPENFEGVIT